MPHLRTPTRGGRSGTARTGSARACADALHPRRTHPTRYRHPMALGWKLHGDGATVSSSTIVAPDERLSWGRTIGLGVQHVVAMFGATFLVPLITGFPPSTTLLFSFTCDVEEDLVPHRARARDPQMLSPRRATRLGDHVARPGPVEGRRGISMRSQEAPTLRWRPATPCRSSRSGRTSRSCESTVTIDIGQNACGIFQ